MTEKVCGACKFHLERGVCPKAEYKKREDNLTACLSSDPACELFQPKHKKKDEKEEIKVKHSPGFSENSTIFEQIADGKYVFGKDFTETPVFYVGEDTFQPLERCPWPLATKPEAYSSSHELWTEVRSFIYDHLFLPSAELYDVLTAWSLSTWVRELWSVVPYVFFYGPVASGKTRGLEVLHRLCYRGILASNISSAALFRASEEWHPTLLLDETEIYSKDTKTEVIGLLNSGYRRGQYAIRVKQTQQGSELEAFDVFGFKALAGTQGLAQALESRSIMIRMIKARREVLRLIDEKRATEIRNKLLGWRLYTFTSGDSSDLSDLFSEGVGALDFGDGRLQELFSCLLAVSNKGHENIINYAKKIYEMRSSEEKASEEAEIMEILSKNEIINEKNIALTKDIAEAFNSSRNDKEQWKTSSIGWLVRRLGFEKVHTHTGKGWLIDKERLTYLQQIYGITEQPDTPSPEKGQKGQKGHAQKPTSDIDQYFPEGQYPICFICHKPVGNPNDLTNIDGLPCHVTCKREFNARKEAPT